MTVLHAPPKSTPAQPPFRPNPHFLRRRPFKSTCRPHSSLPPHAPQLASGALASVTLSTLLPPPTVNATFDRFRRIGDDDEKR
ncbi:hypothetical protein JCM10213_006709 [Rhodosporidiobolus nylandii]